MTCIVGLVRDGEVYIGGDSSAVSGWDLVVRADQKVFTTGEFVFGFTTSWRMGQILRWVFEPPEIDGDLERYMATVFIDAVRKCLKDAGFAKLENSVEEGGQFLVGCRGRLFQVHSDYQVGESTSGFDAVGCGFAYALGALHAMPLGSPPEALVTRALEIAQMRSAGVRGPFHVVSTLPAPAFALSGARNGDGNA